MDIVVLPRDSEIVAVGVAVAIEGYDCLVDGVGRTCGVFDNYHVVAKASRGVADYVFVIAEARAEEAILKV